MDRLYKTFCVWMVVAIVLMGLAPALAAEGPAVPAIKPDAQGTRIQFVPPRPDLMAKLQEAPAGRPGFRLNPSLGAKEAEAAYQKYLAAKLGPQSQREAARQASAKLQAPPNNRLLVALVEFPDLLHNQIPQPNPQNNTDYWVQDFNWGHYDTMLFDASPTNPSLHNYFKEASYAATTPYNLLGDIRNWFQVPWSAWQYGNDDPTDGVDEAENPPADPVDADDIVEDAADRIAQGGWTPINGGWAAYASSGSIVDYFVVVHAGRGQEAGGGALGDDAIWSNRGTLETPYPISGTTYFVKDYIIVSEDAPVGVLAHEMGHMFGLPDTWNPPAGAGSPPWPYQDTGGAGEPSPAFWDTMSSGCWLGRPLGTRPATMISWERIRLGWLTPANWNLRMMPSSLHLSPLGTRIADNKALRIDLPSYANSGTHVRWAYDAEREGKPSYLTHTLQITSTGSAQFQWWHNYDIGPNRAYFQVRSALGATATLRTFTGSSSGWVRETVDLSAYLGQLVDVIFYLNRSYGPEGAGWFLDDFSLIENGQTTWTDNTETSALGPGQGNPTLGYAWLATRFPWITAQHYYLAEWRDDSDEYSFDFGLQTAYNMVDKATGKAQYFRYNPGLLLWYANPRYELGDNDVTRHPGYGFLLAIDAHHEPLFETSTGRPWRTRVQMQDATFRLSAPTYQNRLTDSGGALNIIGPLPAVPFFWDRWTSYPYWDPRAPDNSAKTHQYGVRLDVEGENPGILGATIFFSIDAGNMRTSAKRVDKAVAVPGEPLQYTIVLTNTGIADAHTIVVSDTAPAHTSYVINSVSVTPSDATYILNQNNGIYWMGTVRLGSPVTITFQVMLDSVIDDGTVITNVARVYEGNVPEVDLYAYTRIQSEPCLTSSTKSSDPGSVLAGDQITYTIELVNTGNSNARVLVTDCIPTQCTTYVSGSLRFPDGTQGRYDPQTNCIYWSGTVRAQGHPVYITFRVKVNEGQIPCTLITNRATINDNYHVPFDITTNTTVRPGANLADSTKTVNRAEAGPGDQLNYTITVHNSGNRTASVSVDDDIPANTIYLPGSLSWVGGGAGQYDSVENEIEWAGTLGIGASATIQFSVIIVSPLRNLTMITNTAEIVDNGSARTYYRSANTLVLSGPRLTNSAKTVRGADSGSVLTYTISLINDGNQDAPNVLLTDTIPSGTVYRAGSLSVQPGSAPSPVYDPTHNRITWHGPLAAGSRVTLTFGVNIVITGTGIITNVATVNDGVNDPFNLIAVTRVAAAEVVVPTTPVYCGDTIAVPIRVYNVSDLQGFQMSLSFNPDILMLESIQESSWFAPAAWPIRTWDNDLGTATVVAMLLARPTGLSGSGDLFILHFRAVGDGTSPINITYSLLSNSPGPAFTPIPHNRVNGSVTVRPRIVTGRVFLQGRSNHEGAHLMYGSRELAESGPDGVYSFCPPLGYGQSFMLRVEEQGYLWTQKVVAINVTGTLTLPDVTLLGGDPIGPQITVVKPVTCTAPLTVTVAGPADGRINVLDLAFVGARFGKTPASSDWEPTACHPEYMTYRADINEDDYVNIFDLVLVGNNFGKIAPNSIPWPW